MMMRLLNRKGLIVIVCLSFAVTGYAVSRAVSTDSQLLRCSKVLRKSKTIGPEGGEIVLPPVKLYVPKGALVKDTVVHLRRIPYNPKKPSQCSYLDRYTAEPFLLTVAGDRPFRFHWHLIVDESMPPIDKKKGAWVICPKISWTKDINVVSCYEVARKPSRYSRIISYHPFKFRTTFLRRVLKSGCYKISDSDKQVKMVFFSDRLSHFRLLPTIGDWDDFGKVVNLKKIKRDNDYSGQRCTYVPESVRRFFCYDPEGEEFWNPVCKDNSDCRRNPNRFWDDFICRRRVGHCTDIGLCLQKTIICSPSKQYVISVCGCDGVTYRNICEAEKAGISIRSKGPCEEVMDKSP